MDNPLVSSWSEAWESEWASYSPRHTLSVSLDWLSHLTVRASFSLVVTAECSQNPLYVAYGASAIPTSAPTVFAKVGPVGSSAACTTSAPLQHRQSMADCIWWSDKGCAAAEEAQPNNRHGREEDAKPLAATHNEYNSLLSVLPPDCFVYRNYT